MTTTQLVPAPLDQRTSLALIASYQSETGEIRYAPEPLQARLALFLCVGLLASLAAISVFFPLDRVVASNYGQIVTTQPTTVLQALDPSIIRSINVTEGQRVSAGTVLATLDPTDATADVVALRTQVASLDAEIARCQAELAHRVYLPPATGDMAAYGYASLQRSNFLQRQSQYEATVKSSDEQIEGARATLARVANDAARYRERVRIAEEVEAVRRREETLSVGARLTTLAATDTKTDLQRDMETDQNSLAETAHLLGQLVATRDAFIQQWDAATSLELNTARTTRDTARAQLDKAGHHSDLVRVTAAQDSVVLELPRLSVGSVLKEGDNLITLASLSSPMQAEVEILVRDMGFVRPGDWVTIKLDPFQFVEHGTATGRVSWISEGTFATDPLTGNTLNAAGQPIPPYYKARIDFTNLKLHDVPANFRLVPGMTLQADIHVGVRSLFMYLVRGLVRGLDESMREP